MAHLNATLFASNILEVVGVVWRSAVPGPSVRTEKGYQLYEMGGQPTV